MKAYTGSALDEAFDCLFVCLLVKNSCLLVDC
jgi:hypothetical protein